MTTANPNRAPKGNQDKPTYIANFLNLLRPLIAYAKRLQEKLPECVNHPDFHKFASAWAYHDPARMLRQIHRGLLRAMALEAYLLARLKRGRDIQPTPPEAPAEPADIAAMEFNVRPQPEKPEGQPPKREHPARNPPADIDDPHALTDPTPWELRAWLRSKPVGVLMAEVCLEFGVTPSNTVWGTFKRIWGVLQDYDHSRGLIRYFAVGDRRRQRFTREHDFPSYGWRRDATDCVTVPLVRAMLGFACGDPEAEPVPPSG